MFSKRTIGMFNKIPVDLLSITNKNRITISVMTLGATWYEFNVPNKSNGFTNLILNLKEPKDYLENSMYLCQSIGRAAGRIGDNKLIINGEYIILPKNEHDTTLHGGPNGFNTQFWKARHSGNSLIFSNTISSSKDGFPGTMNVTITYTLTDSNRVIINYSATCDKVSLFNPTCHVYFNLSDSDSTVLDHTLRLNSDKRLELNQKNIPTNRILDNTDSLYDFSSEKLLGDTVKELYIQKKTQIDDIFIQNDNIANEPFVLLKNNCHQISIFSNRNGLVTFLTDSFPQSLPLVSRTSQPFIGIALEAQTLPNAVSNTEFGDIFIHPSEPKTYNIEYQYDSIV